MLKDLGPKKREYCRKRREENPTIRLSVAFSHRMRESLKHGKQGRSWESIVGYTCNDLRDHLEKLFTEGMSWENYGFRGWHIDHKIPIVFFNYQTTEDQSFKECWSLNNLQPLWWKDNLSKGKKIK